MQDDKEFVNGSAFLGYAVSKFIVMAIPEFLILYQYFDVYYRPMSIYHSALPPQIAKEYLRIHTNCYFVKIATPKQ